MTVLVVAVRAVHLAAVVLAFGAFAALLLAGAPRWSTAQQWERGVLRGARAVLGVALASGLALLAQQVASAEGRAAAVLEAGAWLTLLADTEAGRAWALRHGLLAVLTALAVLTGGERGRLDRVAVRAQAALLAAAALAALAGGGHALSAEPALPAVTAHALHALTAGLWLGPLPWLAMLLARASSPAGADARPYAVLAVRRFSGLALGAVVVIAASGAVNAAVHVGGAPGLLGTPYGHVLLVKLALLAGILAVATVNRRRLLPLLGADGPTVGRPAMRRLARRLGVETALGLAALGAASLMALTPPGRHAAPTWPLPFRLDLDLAGAARPRVLVGSQLAVLGLVALLAAAVARSRRSWLLAGGLGLAAAGVVVALPPLAVEAYPTSYRRPPVAYTAASLARGDARYREHCARCHGPAGAGDGPEAAGLPVPPGDLRGPRTVRRTAGELFWLISRGAPVAGMPAFESRLAEAERWDLVNYVRALGAVLAARGLGPDAASTRPRVVAPDFTFGVGPMTARLRDYRGRRHVLIVLYALPASRPRLERLAGGYAFLAALGAEVIAVPRDAAPDALRRLGSRPPIYYPVVTEGAADILKAYGPFARTPHAELLVDRRGYLRARWLDDDLRPPDDLRSLVAALGTLNEEPAAVPAAELHAH